MFEPRKTPPEKLKLVSWYMTPYAVLLVVMGLIFGHPPIMEARLTVAILVLSILVNLSAMVGLHKAPGYSALIRDLRVGINIVCNFWLIYILLPYWPEIWMLLLLVVIALSVYDSREATFLYCCAFGCLLIFVAYMKGIMIGVRMGQVFLYALTLLFVGLFINRLVDVVESQGGPSRGKP